MLAALVRKSSITQNAYINSLRRTPVPLKLHIQKHTLCTSVDNYNSAYRSVFGDGDNEKSIAFLGTGPMALSMGANLVKIADMNGMPSPKIVLLTEQETYYNTLKTKGFSVLDERDGSITKVAADQLIVVKSVEEYEETCTNTTPSIVFGTMQMGQKVERWGIANIAATRTDGNPVAILTAANGIPFTTMIENVPKTNSTIHGHATLYAKGRVDISEDGILVTCTDNGRISVGAVGEDMAEKNEWFNNIRVLMDGPVYATELAANAEKEAMTKVIRNLTNCICLALTTAQYHISGSTSDLKAMPYGAHLSKSFFLNTLNIATYQACRALGMPPKESATQIVENLKYVMGPAVNKFDMDEILQIFADGIDDIQVLEKRKPSLNSAEVRHRMFERLSKKISKKIRKEVWGEFGSTHPPTDAQAASTATLGGRFGEFIPGKPIENKVIELIRHGLNRGCGKKEHMNVLEAFSELYDAYNESVKNQEIFQLPESIFQVIEDCGNEYKLLANVDDRIQKLSWKQAESVSKSGISVAANRKQWLGESAIRNAKLIAELTKLGFVFLRYDVGGVGLPEAPAVIEARKSFAAGNNKYSPICEPEVLSSLAKFYTDTGNGRQFQPSEVMVLGVRAKGALPWMLDFVGNGPVFVPRPTYNPNPSAGLYHSREVLSFDVTGPHRYAPMIEAIRKHKGSGLIALPIIGNPYSVTLTEEEEQGFIEVLRENQSMGFFGDHAYRGYNCYKEESDGPIKAMMPTRDVMEAGGFYDESPKDPVTGKMRNFRVVTHSSSKLFNDASGPGTVAAHADTITFLGDMLRGSFTQAHQRDRRTIPTIVENIDYNAPKRWFDAMQKFDNMTSGKVPGFRDLGADVPPFKCYDASEFLTKYDLHPEEAQHYFMSRTPGLCGIFGGFGPGSNQIFRLGFTGEAPERATLLAERFIEYTNDEQGIKRFKAREDINTRTFYEALEKINASEQA